LSLFSRTHSIWHVHEIIESLRYSRASGYRYVKELVDAGFRQ
jgi:DNA-binding IclR family transcriptional regulator